MLFQGLLIISETSLRFVGLFTSNTTPSLPVQCMVSKYLKEILRPVWEPLTTLCQMLPTAPGEESAPLSWEGKCSWEKCVDSRVMETPSVLLCFWSPIPSASHPRLSTISLPPDYLLPEIHSWISPLNVSDCWLPGFFQLSGAKVPTFTSRYGLGSQGLVRSSFVDAKISPETDGELVGILLPLAVSRDPKAKFISCLN